MVIEVHGSWFTLSNNQKYVCVFLFGPYLLCLLRQKPKKAQPTNQRAEAEATKQLPAANPLGHLRLARLIFFESQPGLNVNRVSPFSPMGVSNQK